MCVFHIYVTYQRVPINMGELQNVTHSQVRYIFGLLYIYIYMCMYIYILYIYIRQ